MVYTGAEEVLFFLFTIIPFPNALLDLVLPSPKHATTTTDHTLNYYGASVFVSYIIAALVLTGLISHDLNRALKHEKQSKGGAIPCPKLLISLACLAFISFATLSYNMLAFLVQSYLNWTKVYQSSTTTSVASVWEWMTTSTLFLDFAQALCWSKGVFAWSEKALMVTLMSNLYMDAAGRYYRIKNLPRYFCIGQILPISFALNLFFIALTLKGKSNVSIYEKVKPISRTSKQAQTSVRFSIGKLVWLVLVIYRSLIAILPRLVNTSQFMRLVLLTRLMLFLPLLKSMFHKQQEAIFLTNNMIAYALLLVLFGGLELADLSTSHAVSALGYDMIICVFSVVIWKCGQFQK